MSSGRLISLSAYVIPLVGSFTNVNYLLVSQYFLNQGRDLLRNLVDRTMARPVNRRRSYDVCGDIASGICFEYPAAKIRAY